MAKRKRDDATAHCPEKDSELDAGLEEIHDWHQWFLSAHTARIAEADLTADARERELAAVTDIATAAADRMRSDYLTRRQP